MPIETGGGILADDMGLGKTLTMLSAIIRTADEANAFACGHNHSLNLTVEHALIPSRATLVVVPSPCKASLYDFSGYYLTLSSTTE
jgi:SNF2 family DNA or RNA helicase